MRPLILFVFLYAGCTSHRNTNLAMIIGHVRQLPAHKVYLTDAYNWRTFLDSADYYNDTFRFDSLHLDEPFVASICFINGFGQIQQLIYRNTELSGGGKEYGSSGFMLENGVTTITGTIDTSIHRGTNKLQIETGLENKSYFKTQLIDFGYIPATDSLKKLKIFDYYARWVSDYTHSHYFLQRLYNYKTLYKLDDLEKLYNLFDKTVQQSPTGLKLSQFIATGGTHLLPLDYSKYLFTDSLGKKRPVIDSTFSLHMLVFWASWCGPCRKEIPEIKKINKEFEIRGLAIRSISIDRNEDAWKKALLQEKMPWRQYIIDRDKLEATIDTLGIPAIPVIVFADSLGKEMVRFSGFDTSDTSKYRSFIRSHIKL